MTYSSQSKYHVIVDEIKAAIYSGALGAGEALRSEKQLSEEYGVSRSTVRKALSVLVEEELILSLQGKGYFVSMPKLSAYKIFLDAEDNPLKVRLIGVRIIKVGKSLKNKMKYYVGSKALEIRRYYYSSDTLTGYGVKYLPYSSNEPLLEREFQYTSFEDNGSGDAKTLLCRPLAADEELAETLRTQVGAPLMSLEQTVVDQANNVCSYELMYMLGDQYAIRGD